ncbi:MAG: hypothetical protein U9M89_02965 [Patescibacteria group bacterium]|nr:hypothetical protein [Patescibacteria group bacterium]
MFNFVLPAILVTTINFSAFQLPGLDLDLSAISEKQKQLPKLEQFLEDKNSPMPASELLKYSNWEMIVALSNAESGYGKHRAGTYNAWGIKDFRKGSTKFGKTRDFNSWAESIEYTSKLLFKYDPEDGEPTASGMVAKWKYVKPYGHWINNVNYSLASLAKYDLIQV